MIPRTQESELILESLRALIAPGQVAELRALEVSTPDFRRSHTVSGYFDDLQKMAHAAAALAPS